MRDRTICRQDAGSTLGVNSKPPLNRYPPGISSKLINGNGITWTRNFRGHEFGSPIGNSKVVDNSKAAR